jgi:hypothetical protein
VIGCGTREGSERGSRETVVLGMVEEHTVEPSQSWFVLAISPSKEAVKERKLKQSHGVNHGVEGPCESCVEIVVILL